MSQYDYASWEIVIGLEVHCQIISKSKLFSASATDFGNQPNTNVSFMDAAMPGTLPVLNQECVRQAVKTGLGLNAKINKKSIFSRKNYFYADLPHGYQISQFDQPIVESGFIRLHLANNITKDIKIARLHLEQDAGKSLHNRDSNYSYIDLNRSGIGLMEIVSMPDIRSAQEAGAYLSKLRTILRYLGTCDGDMSQGSMRCDANISVRKPGNPYGKRCEIKNINSIRFVMQAIEIESKRQISILENGGQINEETRLFDEHLLQTRPMRSKETIHDYRYFPEPDLLPLILTDEFITKIKRSLPELPDKKKARFIRDYKLSDYEVSILIAEKEKADYYEAVVNEKDRNSKLVANWVITNLFSILNKLQISITESPISKKYFGELLDLISNNTISERIAKDVFEIMIKTGDNPLKIIQQKDLIQINDIDKIEKIIDEILQNNIDKVKQYQSGKEKILSWLIGQVMRFTQGKANPIIVNKIMIQKIKDNCK